MKIVCEYCGAYVEVVSNNVCPCCTAPLGDAVIAAEKKLEEQKKREETKRAAQFVAQMKAEEDARKKQMLMDIASTAAGVALGGIGRAALRGLFRRR